MPPSTLRKELIEGLTLFFSIIEMVTVRPNLPLFNRVVSARRANRYTFAACETVAAGVNSHH